MEGILEIVRRGVEEGDEGRGMARMEPGRMGGGKESRREEGKKGGNK